MSKMRFILEFMRPANNSNAGASGMRLLPKVLMEMPHDKKENSIFSRGPDVPIGDYCQCPWNPIYYAAMTDRNIPYFAVCELSAHHSQRAFRHFDQRCC